MAEEETLEQRSLRLAQAKRAPFAPATATWKISQETFRRLARTGEFAEEQKS